MESLVDAFGAPIRVGSVIAYASRDSCQAYLSRAIVREIVTEIETRTYRKNGEWVSREIEHPALKVSVVGTELVTPQSDDPFYGYDKPVLRKTVVRKLDRVVVTPMTEEQFMQRLDREGLDAYTQAAERWLEHQTEKTPTLSPVG